MKPFTIAPDGRSITCGFCRMTSWNLNDVINHYCGNCHRFLDDRPVPEPRDYKRCASLDEAAAELIARARKHPKNAESVLALAVAGRATITPDAYRTFEFEGVEFDACFEILMLAGNLRIRLLSIYLRGGVDLPDREASLVIASKFLDAPWKEFDPIPSGVQSRKYLSLA